MQAIRTRWRGATNTKPSQIIASCDAGKHQQSYDHTLSPDDNHKAAAKALRDRLGWQHHGDMIAGYQPDGSRAWVFDNPMSDRLKAEPQPVLETV